MESVREGVEDRIERFKARADILIIREDGVDLEISSIIKPILQSYLFEKDSFELRTNIAKTVQEHLNRAFSNNSNIALRVIPNEIHRAALISILCLQEACFDVFIVPKSIEVKNIENA
ncbi:MAG: hypothetical protein WC346_06050 [Methanogenium sp.]|jgi:hypothetical protein